MEQNLPIVTKKICKMVQVLYFMLRKGISKAKLLTDLRLMLKNGKIAGKAAIHNLISHHHDVAAVSRSRFRDEHISFPAYYREYEFSCRNSPAYGGGSFRLGKRKHSRRSEENLMAAAGAAMELMINSEAASPPLPGFGASPLARQLRITDSPFPLREGEEDHCVDEAAEEFITKFYQDLRQQHYLGYY